MATYFYYYKYEEQTSTLKVVVRVHSKNYDRQKVARMIANHYIIMNYVA